jgi:ABC-type antimicrobial peptide transport system permease subunit
VRFVLVGAAIAGLLAFVAARWMQPLLFEQSARDPVVFAGVGALILAVALAASAVPALRASRTDPATALRTE